MAYNTTDLVNVNQLKKSAQKASDKAAALEETINNKLTSVYKIKGSKTFSELTTANPSLLAKANEGNVYNISDAFTTTSDFIEEAGKKHTAGSNVVVVEATAAVYTESSDNSINAEKTYYIFRNGGYVEVTPEGEEDPSDEGWYELTTPATYKFDVHAGDLSNLQVLAVPTAAGNIATLNSSGQVTDSTVAIATDEEVEEMLGEVWG